MFRLIIKFSTSTFHQKLQEIYFFYWFRMKNCGTKFLCLYNISKFLSINQIIVNYTLRLLNLCPVVLFIFSQGFQSCFKVTNLISRFPILSQGFLYYLKVSYLISRFPILSQGFRFPILSQGFRFPILSQGFLSYLKASNLISRISKVSKLFQGFQSYLKASIPISRSPILSQEVPIFISRFSIISQGFLSYLKGSQGFPIIS